MNVTVYLLGILLQAVAAVMALIQVRQAPRKLPWLLIAISSALIVVRRAATLGQFTQAHRELAEAEVLTTVISALFFLAVVLMARMFREVSEAKAVLERSREATLEAETKHARLFNVMPQGVAYQDAEGRILSANPAAERILGLTLDQMQGRTNLDPMWRTMHEDGSPFHGETHPATVALRTGKPVNNEVMGVFNPATGTTRWISICAIPLFQPGEASPFQVYTTFQDITEPRQAQKIMAEHQARFQSYFDLGLISMAITSPEKGWVEVNDELCRTLGYSREELWGMTWAEVTHPDDLDKDVAQFQRVMCGEIDAYRLEKRFIRKDGTLVYTELSVQAVRQMNGTVEHFVAMFYDISERKLAEQALAQKQRQLQAILDFSPTLISVKDLNGTVVLANRNFEILDAPPLHELIGRDVFDLFPKEVAEALWQNDLAALQADAPVQAEEQVPHKDGSWHTYLTVKFPLRDEHNQPFGVCAISTDISDRKQAEERIKTSEAMLATTQEAARAGSWSWDMATGRLAWSKGMFILFGLPPASEATFEAWRSVVHPDDLAGAEMRIQEAITQRKPLESEYRVVLPGGAIRWINAPGQTTYDKDGRPLRMMG